MCSNLLGCSCFSLCLSLMCTFRYLQADPEHFDLRDLKCEFDVILLEPPLEEYYRESGISHTERFWTWDDVRLLASHATQVCTRHVKAAFLSPSSFHLLPLQIMKLEIEEISALRSFVFLWCGSGEGLDLGRMVNLIPRSPRGAVRFNREPKRVPLTFIWKHSAFTAQHWC